MAENKTKVKKVLFIPISIALVILPFLVALICLGIGRYHLSMGQTIKVLFSGITGAEVTGVERSVVFNVRLPRIILAAAVGAGLSCSGTAFQSLFTNPLATPDTLGVASGASFGAVLVMMMGGNLIWVQFGALVFGLISCVMVFVLGRTKTKTSIVMVVLAGMVISALFQALVSLLKYVADPEDQLPAITYWLMGSMSGASYKNLILGVPFIAVGLFILIALRWRLNILSLSEDEARSLGVNVKALRVVIILASSMITASCISMCGQVGWVGLLVPHISRMLTGSDNKSVIPVSISLGAVCMLVMDTVSRAATSAEIPISILTAIIGAPFFIGLLKKTGGAQL